METSKKMAELLQRIRLDQDEVNERFRFLQLDPDDGARLDAASEDLLATQQAFVEQLYDHLQAFATPAELLRDKELIGRLKQSQNNYYRRLWDGRYDADYVSGRLRIGLIHQQVGLELKWYLGAYRLYLDEMLRSLIPDSASRETYASLLKVVFFDMTLAIDSYTAAQHKALEDSEARFARALRGANDGIWDWHLDDDRLYVSQRWAEMLGLSRDGIGETSSSWFSRVHPDDLPGLRHAIDAHLHGRAASLHHEYRMRRQDGDYLWVLVRGVADTTPGGNRRMAGSQTDISARRDAEQYLRHAARHDPLTGLSNRTQLDEQLLQARLQLQEGKAREAALLFIDLDRFKLINDSLGHTIGDRVLVAVAQRLSECLRPGDQLFRFGGDEFIVLLDNLARSDDAERVAQRILDRLHHPLALDERTLVVSASIGIAPLHEQGRPLDVLLAADLALYRAKAAGKAQFARYSVKLQAAAQRQLELESALGQALERNEFALHYQPICQLGGEQPQLAGVEALLRWRQGDRLVSPAEFIPVLEESGQIIRVGEWVLREACRQTRQWQQQGWPDLYCSVNISSRQLQQADFVPHLIDILRESDLPPTSLTLEITESLLMQDDRETLLGLRELADLGIRLALDDFGTGYSSLGYLSRFPLHVLKIDRSFIIGTPHDHERSTICRAIIGLGQALGLEVVAEGVEQDSHRQFILDAGCRQAQGYWFSAPRSAADLASLLHGETAWHQPAPRAFQPLTSPDAQS